jgi:hypothetical protein
MFNLTEQTFDATGTRLGVGELERRGLAERAVGFLHPFSGFAAASYDFCCALIKTNEAQDPLGFPGFQAAFLLAPTDCTAGNLNDLCQV